MVSPLVESHRRLDLYSDILHTDNVEEGSYMSVVPDVVCTACEDRDCRRRRELNVTASVVGNGYLHYLGFRRAYRREVQCLACDAVSDLEGCLLPEHTALDDGRLPEGELSKRKTEGGSKPHTFYVEPEVTADHRLLEVLDDNRRKQIPVLRQPRVAPARGSDAAQDPGRACDGQIEVTRIAGISCKESTVAVRKIVSHGWVPRSIRICVYAVTYA